MLKDLIEYIAKSLVDDPDSVHVTEIEGEQTSVIELKVAKEDLGKVIGKHGRIAKAHPVVQGLDQFPEPLEEGAHGDGSPHQLHEVGVVEDAGDLGNVVVEAVPGPGFFPPGLGGEKGEEGGAEGGGAGAAGGAPRAARGGGHRGAGGAGGESRRPWGRRH